MVAGTLVAWNRPTNPSTSVGRRLHVDVPVNDIEDAADPLESLGNEFRPVTKHGEDRG